MNLNKFKTFIPTLSKITRTCRRVLLWSHSTQTYQPTQTHSSGCFLFTVIVRMSLFVPAGIFFSLSWPVRTKSSTRMFSYHRHSPHKITCPYKQAFIFLYRSLHRPTRPQGYLLFTDISHSDLLAHTDVLQPLARSTQPTCPYGHFLFTDIAHTGFKPSTRDSTVAVRLPDPNTRKQYTILRPCLDMVHTKTPRRNLYHFRNTVLRRQH